MPVTEQELDSFHQFAKSRLAAAPPDSLEECLNEWRQVREYEETVADVRRSEAEFAAGLHLSVEESIASIRRELGLTAEKG